MCGLTGFLDASRATGDDELAAVARSMAEAIHHRGPDDAGTWVDPAAGVAFGFRRLAIVDLSAEGHQPMISASGRYVIVFNGEIYNYRAIRAELELADPGIRFRGHSDTEVLLAAIERWGVRAAIERTVGMFAIALWDRREGRLHLVRDRLGEKPLYYGWLGRTFLFGSELKALRAHPAFAAEIDRNAVALFLRHKYVPAPYSIYRGIAKLPPGTMVSVSPRAPGEMLPPVAYWSAAEAATNGVTDPFAGSENEAVDRLEALLREAVGLQMVADVPLGALLSGGIDSSTVVALMQAQSPRPIKTFTIGFSEEHYNEAVHAKAVANHLGTDHQELYVGPDAALDVIPKLPTLYDEPFADASQIPTYLVSELARRQVTVGLSGDGGDELFGGYVRHLTGDRLWQTVRRVPQGPRRVVARGLAAVPPSAWERGLGATSLLPFAARQRVSGDRIRKAARVLHAGDPEELYRLLLSDWSETGDVVPGCREPLTPLTDPRHRLAALQPSERMMYLDTVMYLPDDILVKVDRASMGVSLEVRAPFLDHRVVEFAWCLPLAMKIRAGQGKWALRQVLYRHVPRSLVERPKQGFAVPVESWLRGPLRAWAEALLAEGRLRSGGILDPAPIRRKWAEHLSGKRDWPVHLWSVLMLEAWLEAQESALPQAAD